VQFLFVLMIVLVTDFATMDHVTVDKDFLDLIVQFPLVQIIAILVDHVLTHLAVVSQDGLISIAQLDYALTNAV